MTRVAVVLMNLGGPDTQDAVQPFLFNLFNDPAIISLPTLLRWPLAKFISARRAPIARKIYSEMGGGSPLLPNTEAQAGALEERLRESSESLGVYDWKVFLAMRYWHPMSEACARDVKAYLPDIVVLLPLYPQFSTTTSASSVRAWRRAAGSIGLESVLRTVCCYPTQGGFIDAVAGLLEQELVSLGAADPGSVRLLFSAHGLPKKVIASGDPYQWQVEQAADAVVTRLKENRPEWTDLESVVCYQSRVGPLEWIGPSTDDEIVRAGQNGKAVVLVPIAFVSEHSETLVELDIEYRELAAENGVPAYHRVATVGTQEPFIAGLADLVRQAVTSEAGLCSQDGARICPAQWSRCREKLLEA